MKATMIKEFSKGENADYNLFPKENSLNPVLRAKSIALPSSPSSKREMKGMTPTNLARIPRVLDN